MKRKKIEKKLALNKETIAGLEDKEKKHVVGGGATETASRYCLTKTGCPSEWPCGTDYWGCHTNWGCQSNWGC